ncbi:MAG: hypothetical protein A2020_00640 [Lentisphaerae bacterium GWF2_45_14]|nr:MAG: hypothetical protein A2020_00640 [Lentisphaerae bacterium GWF2_45_14]
MKRFEVSEILIFALIAAIAGAFIFFSFGCRTRTRQEFEFRQNELVKASYMQEDGFHFFSDAEGKTLSPSLNLNGIQF